jgi:hypothetical protein
VTRVLARRCRITAPSTLLPIRIAKVHAPTVLRL